MQLVGERPSGSGGCVWLVLITTLVSLMSSSLSSIVVAAAEQQRPHHAESGDGAHSRTSAPSVTTSASQRRPDLRTLSLLYRSMVDDTFNHAVTTEEQNFFGLESDGDALFEGVIGLVSAVDGRHWCPTMRPLIKWINTKVGVYVL